MTKSGWEQNQGQLLNQFKLNTKKLERRQEKKTYDHKNVSKF